VPDEQVFTVSLFPSPCQSYPDGVEIVKAQDGDAVTECEPPSPVKDVGLALHPDTEMV
jgi:hypothetical protein